MVAVSEMFVLQVRFGVNMVVFFFLLYLVRLVKKSKMGVKMETMKDSLTIISAQIKSLICSTWLMHSNNGHG